MTSVRSISFFIFSFILTSLLLFLFYFVSKKSTFDMNTYSGFECGFSSYYFTRSSFSIHYFLVALVFLFLDLELSFIFLFFMEDHSSKMFLFFLIFFVFFLLMGLFLEWWEFNLDWVF